MRRDKAGGRCDVVMVPLGAGGRAPQSIDYLKEDLESIGQSPNQSRARDVAPHQRLKRHHITYHDLSRRDAGSGRPLSKNVRRSAAYCALLPQDGLFVIPSFVLCASPQKRYDSAQLDMPRDAHGDEAVNSH